MLDRIAVRGARQHNLKNFDIELPRERLTVVTGLSGSGKSSLAFDVIYAEGQRRYVQTLSAYARQFLDQLDRPDVDSVEGLSPAISIEQKTTSRSPRSTVGTITEIYDYLRLLYATIGAPHCPRCGRAISRQTTAQIVDSALELVRENGAGAERVMVLAPIVRGRKGEFQKVFEDLRRQGYVRARVDGQLKLLDEDISLDRRRNHTIEVVVDRLLIKPEVRGRLAASVEAALKLAHGVVEIAVVNGEERLYSQESACPECGINVPALEPRSFSFNSPYGACETCHGLGSLYSFDPAKIVVDWSRPLLDGGLGPGANSTFIQRTVRRLAEQHGFDLRVPFGDLPAKYQNLILYGAGARRSARAAHFAGIIPLLDQWYNQSQSESFRDWFSRYMSPTLCPRCRGKRLQPASLAVKVANLSIADFTALSIAHAQRVIRKITLTPRQELLARRILNEVADRLEFLAAVGLDYLSLDRSAATLSSGESQRVRLATQIGSKLRGVLYVLDEPSIGLHPRDNRRLIETLERLRDLGNTVLVVEHDEETIRHADHVIDLGPGAGRLGGFVVAAGPPAAIAKDSRSLTGQYLSQKLRIPIPEARRRPQGKWLSVMGASANNLKNVDINFPLGAMTVVTGVSGSGKSTLVNDILYRALARQLYRAIEEPGAHRGIRGANGIDKVIVIDQSPIGRSPRSNPATYSGLFTPIRELFAMLPEARERGYRPGRFSFNVKGGRCETCQGEGQRRIEMNFLPDVHVTCETCRGRRYNSETLAVKYDGHSIADVLEMTVKDALALLDKIPMIRAKLETLNDVGLGYIHLGQPATTLSGGEAQRVKLARELSRRQTGRTLYILDEPTTGLHFADVHQLLDVLNRLTDLGNTIIIIEHNLDVVKQADWIIDLGPEGGERGGSVVAEGPPEKIARSKGSYTGRALKKIFERSRPIIGVRAVKSAVAMEIED